MEPEVRLEQDFFETEDVITMEVRNKGALHIHLGNADMLEGERAKQTAVDEPFRAVLRDEDIRIEVGGRF